MHFNPRANPCQAVGAARICTRVYTESMGTDALLNWLDGRTQGTPYGIAVVRGGNVLVDHYAGGAGPQNRWDIGSIRKSFNSALAGQAIAEGLIALETPAHRMWPGLVELSGQDDDREITLHHLLGSTSGWLTNDAPGERFRYNNAAFSAAERVLGGALRCEVSDAVTERLIRPLGLADTTARHRDAPFDPNSYGDPGPKLLIESTVCDLLRWGELWLHGGLWSGRALIPAEHVRRATRRVDPHIADSHYGYCWFVNEDLALWPGAPPDSYGHPGVGYNLNGPDPSRSFLWICPSLELAAAICADPCAGIADDYRNVPMPVTAQWIDRVLEVAS